MSRPTIPPPPNSRGTAQPSPTRVAAVLGTVALVAGIWTRYGANVGAGVTAAMIYCFWRIS